MKNLIKSVSIYAISVIVMYIFCMIFELKPNEFIIGSWSMIIFMNCRTYFNNN